jgi:hypothetical protein
MKKRFSHPASSHFCPSPLDSNKASTLDVFVKVQSTFKHPMDFLQIKCGKIMAAITLYIEPLVKNAVEN